MIAWGDDPFTIQEAPMLADENPDLTVAELGQLVDETLAQRRVIDAAVARGTVGNVRKRHPLLAKHRSYSRLAAKAEKAGDTASAVQYRAIAAQYLADYHRATGS